MGQFCCPGGSLFEDPMTELSEDSSFKQTSNSKKSKSSNLIMSSTHRRILVKITETTTSALHGRVHDNATQSNTKSSLSKSPLDRETVWQRNRRKMIMKHGKTAYRRPSNVPLMDSPETPPCIGTSSNKSKDIESDIDFSVEEEELTSITNMDDLIKVQSDEDEKQNLHPDIKDLPSGFVFPKNLVTMKSTSRNSELGICFGVSQIIGGRSYQEDTFVCVPRLVRSKKDSVAFFAVYVRFSLSSSRFFYTHSKTTVTTDTTEIVPRPCFESVFTFRWQNKSNPCPQH